VYDELVSAVEHEHHSPEQSRLGVKAEAQLVVGRAVVVQELNPQRPFDGLDRVLLRDAALGALR